SRDQREVGDEPVHRAEHRGPQPASGDVAVPVVALRLRSASRVGHVSRTRGILRRPLLPVLDGLLPGRPRGAAVTGGPVLRALAARLRVPGLPVPGFFVPGLLVRGALVRRAVVHPVLVRPVLVRTVLVRTVLVRTVLVRTVLVRTVLVRTVLVRG